MCGSPSDTRALVHIEQPLCTVYTVPRAAYIKTLLMFLSGKLQMFTNIITHVSTNYVCLSAVIRCSIICMFHNILKKCRQSISFAVSKWAWRLLAADSFSKITDCLHVVPTSNWTSRICQEHSCSPPTQTMGWTWTLITHHLCTSHIFLSCLRPPTHKSVLVSIETGLVPPPFAVVSNYKCLTSTLFTLKMKWLLFCQTRLIFVSVALVIFLRKIQQKGNKD